MPENMLVLIYTTQSINLPVAGNQKRPIHSLENKFQLLAKAKNRKTFSSGVSVFGRVSYFAGPISFGPDSVGSDHMYVAIISGLSLYNVARYTVSKFL